MKEEVSVTRQIQQLKISLSDFVSKFDHGELRMIEIREDLISQSKDILELKLQIISVSQEIEKNRTIDISSSDNYSDCPVCRNHIEDNSQEKCGVCGWILINEKHLDSKIYNPLLDWAIRYYHQVQDLESRSNYDRLKVNDRLDRQSDTINLLERQLETVLSYLKSESTGYPQDLSIEMISSIDSEVNNQHLCSEETSFLEEYCVTDNSIINNQDNLVYPDISSSPVILDSFTFLEELIKEPSIQLTTSSELDLSPFKLDVKQGTSISENSNFDIESSSNKSEASIQYIILDYYHNPKEFMSKYQVRIANITKNNINANRGSEGKNVVLEETNRGNYWIFNFEDCHYLVPVEDKYINQHSYTTTCTIFTGHNYTPDYQKIQLIKPAIVSIDPNTNPQTWRLQQQGELTFS